MPGANALSQSALLLGFLLFQILLYTLLGAGLLRRLARVDVFGLRTPEFAFLLGLPAAALLGYPVLVLTTSAKLVLPLLCLAAVGLHVRAPAADLVPGLLTTYRDFRAVIAGKLGLVLVGLFVLLVSLRRIWWLWEWTTGGQVSFGTTIWDDLRTIGMPLSLAAHGYPMLSPQALETRLAYPLGAFIYSSGLIAVLPGFVLPILLADVAAAALFYGLTILLAVSALLRSQYMRVLVAASALTTVSFNLFRLPVNIKAPTFDYFFGYYRANGLLSSIAWTPVSGTVWNENHALGFASALLAALCFRDAGLPRWLPFLPAIYTAATSMDMTAMGLAAAGLATLACWRERERVFRGLAVCTAAFITMALVNAPTLLGLTDFPDTTAFPWISVPRYNAGILLSTFGPYLLLAAGGVLVRRLRGQAVPRTPWLLAVGVALAFSLAFEYHSIWFWRASLTLHFLLALVCGLILQGLRTRGWVAFWMLALCVGAVEAYLDTQNSYLYRDRLSPARRELYAWIETNTRLRDRVAAYLELDGALAPDVDFLRTGNRAGRSTYDRDHPLVWYRAYQQRMSHIAEGIAANDYVVYWRDNPNFAALLEGCGAKKAWENQAGLIYAIPATCRTRIWSGAMSDAARHYTHDWLRRRMPLDEGKLRSQVESLWKARKYAEAQSLLERVNTEHPESGEAAYLLGVTLQFLNRCDEALPLHEAAMRNGYTEFWIRLNRGTCFLLLNRRDAARLELLRAQQLNAGHAGLNQLLGTLQ